MHVVEVLGDSEPAKVLREMLIGGRLIELGCGFNPGAPRREIYPAGSNAPGALHFGIDLAAPSDYLRRVLPDWEEPPTHVDLCWFDATVHADATAVISDGELHALRDPEVVQAAAPFGDAEALLHGRPR